MNFLLIKQSYKVCYFEEVKYMKKYLRKIHYYMALFTIPVGFMVAITGVVYIAGLDQDVWAETNTYKLETTIPVGQEVEFLKKWTKENNVKMPKQNVSKDKSGLNRTVGSAGYTITIKESNGKTELLTKDRSLLGNMIMLHKAKGGILFKIMMIFFGIVLAGFYITGLGFAMFKKNVNGTMVPKTEAYVTIAAGFIVTIVFAILSL